MKRFACLALLLCGAFATQRLDAVVTNVVDLATLGRLGTGTTNGWTVTGIDSYADAPGVRLNDKDESLLSPDFGGRVERLLLEVKSSSQSGRKLAFVPWRGEGYDESVQLACSYSANKDTYVRQVLDVPEGLDFTRFKIMLDSGGSTTGWGLRALAVVTAAEPPAPAPVPRLDGERVLVGSCRTAAGDYVFSPDFSVLASVVGATAIDGVVSNILCLARTGEGPATTLNRNPGTTQTQGHYVWTAGSSVSGFGTYTAASVSRSFGWSFRNDTGLRLEVVSLDVTYGQWGALNSQTDALTFAWRVADGERTFADAADWTDAPSDSFVAPHRAGDGFGAFPVFEPQSIRSACVEVPPDATFSVRWTDTCPSGGKNAALGLSSFAIRLRACGKSLTILAR